MIAFDCPSCQAELEADLELAGETIECPSCHRPALVPAGAIARGSRIAGYQIERHLGGGALGEVYVALQLSVERQIALKILPPALAQHAVLTAAFLREARALARVDHPGVVAILDAGSESGCFYLASPLLEGEDLARRMERQGRLSEAEVVHAALDIARVLSNCWDRFALAHLNLKPSNVLVDTQGQIHLLDFGLTGRLFSDPHTRAIVRNLILSPSISPEQLEGNAVLDFRSDLYALGVLLYHLATGRSPYHETVADELASRVLNQPLPPAREANPAISTQFDQLIAALTIKDAQRRPADWNAVITALESMEKTRAAPAPKRPSMVRRHMAAQPAAAPSHVIKLKAGRHLAHHPVAARSPSAAPWVIAVLLILVTAGVLLGLKARHFRSERDKALLAEEAAAQARQAEEMRTRAAELVQAAKRYIETYPDDIKSGREQLRAARERLAGTPFAAALSPELDSLEAKLDERARPAPPEPAPSPTSEPEGAGSDTAPSGEEVSPAQPEPAGAGDLLPCASLLLDRDFQGAADRLPAGDRAAEGVDVALLRKELGELPRWVDVVCEGLRKSIGREQDFLFREGPRTLSIRSVSPTQIRAERVLRDGERVVSRAPANFRLEDLSTDEIIRQLRGERGGVPALMSGLAAYRAGRLSDARAWFNRSTSPWAPLLIRAMDEASAPAP